MATFIEKLDEEGITEFKSTFNYATVDEMVQDLKILTHNGNTNLAYVTVLGLAAAKLNMAQSIFNFSDSNVPEPKHIETFESGIILQGSNIFVRAADGKNYEFWTYKTAEDNDEARKNKLLDDYAYGVTRIRSGRDLAEFKEFLEVAEERFWECHYEPSTFESFSEPFAVFCNVQTETDIDGFDNEVLDISVVFSSELFSTEEN